MHYWQPEPALIKVLCVACVRSQNLYHDPRHKVGVCHVSSIVTRVVISTPRRAHISDASYYATLIKNLLVSVQNRWEKVVSKSAERTRSLDYGFKEAKEFHESWEFLCTWLDEAKGRLDEMGVQSKNDPAKIKREIEKLKDFQKELSSKQPMYDATMKNGKVLTDKAPKPDHPILKEMLTELKNKWMTVCNLSVEKQRKLYRDFLSGSG